MAAEGTKRAVRKERVGVVISDAPGWQLFPAVSDRYVIWEDHRNVDPAEYDDIQLVNADVYGYDLLTGEEFVVYVGDGFQGNPDVSGDRVVWVDAEGYIVEGPAMLTAGAEIAATSTPDFNDSVQGYTRVGVINRAVPEPGSFVLLCSLAAASILRRPKRPS